MINQNGIDIIKYIAKQGLETITSSTSETDPKIDFVNIFFNKIGSSKKPKVLNEPLNEIREQYLSCEKARKMLLWTPTFSFEEGIEKTIAWYKDFFAKYGVSDKKGE